MENYYHTSSTLKNLGDEGDFHPPSSNVYILSFRVYWKGLFFDVNFLDAIRDCRWAIWMRGCELDSRRRNSHKNVSINFGLLSFIIIFIVSKAANDAQTQF